MLKCNQVVLKCGVTVISNWVNVCIILVIDTCRHIDVAVLVAEQ